ncbi:MAG: amidase [Minwuiales bacterium]|nr:amidase [Minwuiales bacterium]
MTEMSTVPDRPHAWNLWSSAEALGVAIAKEETSSAEVTGTFLERIARLDAKFRAYTCVFDEDALLAAQQLDKEQAAGRTRGPLHGVPIAIKDLFDYAGQPTHAGSRILIGRNPAVSAHAVRCLEDAGMVVLGQTHMVEFGFGGWGTNAINGTPWNPSDIATHRVPGGSSSGSAVAVGAGLAPVALGTDTGGSIRTPACWCGVIGLKTSYGLIGRSGAVPLCPTQDTIGPLGRSVRDVALLLDALAGHDPNDPAIKQTPRMEPLTDIERGIDGLRLGILYDVDIARVDSEIRSLFAAALDDIDRLGGHLEPLQLPLPIDAYLNMGGEIMSAESYRSLSRYVDEGAALMDPAVRLRILRGRDISAREYLSLLEQRRLAQVEFLKALNGLDALLVPGCHQWPVPVSEVDENEPPNIFGRFVNFLDLASLAIPIGTGTDGLPAGMQIVVRRFDDALALRIGRAFERARR